jgi:peptidoglycan/xylan/chitin deacetylase (PgdA/CDA1 family)
MGGNPDTLRRLLTHEILAKPRRATAGRRLANFLARPFGYLGFDPYYTFDWYLDTCERRGRRAAFYFISDHSGGAIDGSYEIDEPRIRRLMETIAGRGHEIGMHGSYNTYRDLAQIRRELARLKAAAASAGAEIGDIGNRQHYLRWDAAETPDILEEAGLRYDASGSFADRPGFRYGTSHQFPMWSWRRLEPLHIRQHPLVLMDCSVTWEGYLGMGHTEAALDLMQTLKRRAMRYGGDFTLLWHNSELLLAKDKEFFDLLLK